MSLFDEMVKNSKVSSCVVNLFALGSNDLGMSPTSVSLKFRLYSPTLKAHLEISSAQQYISLSQAMRLYTDPQSMYSWITSLTFKSYIRNFFKNDSTNFDEILLTEDAGDEYIKTILIKEGVWEN